MTDELTLPYTSMTWDGHDIVVTSLDNLPEEGFEAAQAFRRVVESVRIPVTALADVVLVPVTRKMAGWMLFVPRKGASPFHAVMAGEDLALRSNPFLLDFEADKELLTEYYAEEIRTAIRGHGLADVPAERPLVEVPNPFSEFIGSDGQVRLSPTHLTFDWGIDADPAKSEAGRQWRVPLTAVGGIECRFPADTPDGIGYIQVRLAGAPADFDVHPIEDVNAVCLASEDDVAKGLVFAATLYTRVRALSTQVDHKLLDRWQGLYRTDKEDGPIEQLKKLADLRDAGILTESEFQAKKRELLDRI